MVVPVVLWLAAAGGGVAVAAEPPSSAAPDRPAPVSSTTSGTAKSSVKPPRAVPIEEAALQVGVTVPELKRLRQLGFSDPEVATLLQASKRSAHDLITEREVLSEIGKAIDEVSARVYQLPVARQTAEREKTIKAALAKVRRDLRTSRDELRRILASTSYLTPDEQRRFLGGPAFFADDLNLRRTGWFNRSNPQEKEKRGTAVPGGPLPATSGGPLPVDDGGFPLAEDWSHFGR
jgi:hypothetical protein